MKVCPRIGINIHLCTIKYRITSSKVNFHVKNSKKTRAIIVKSKVLSDFGKHKLCLWGKLHPSYIPYCWNHVIAEIKPVSPTTSTTYFRKYLYILQTHYRNVALKYLIFEGNFKCSADKSCALTFDFLLKTQATYGDPIANGYSSVINRQL